MRVVLLLLAVLATLWLLAPSVLMVAAGGSLMLLGVLMLGWWLLPRGLWRRFDVLALLLAIVALVEARRRP